MDKKVATAGNSGPKVRSDCEVVIEITGRSGINIDLTSKVKNLYGESIRILCVEVMKHFGISNAKVSINDSGALPFVIAARIEAAVRQLQETETEYLPPFLKDNNHTTSEERFRFSRLYIPGNTPSLMINAGLHHADGIIFDLEDSVAPARKDEARILVRNALRQISFRGAERMVRINHGETGLMDLKSVIPQNVHMILIPKCESGEYVRHIDEVITLLRKKHMVKNRVLLMPIIETALGVENSFEIARASENVVAIAVGLEDLTADLGVDRTIEGTESFFARSRIVIAAKAAGIQPVDSVFSDVADPEGLQKTVAASKALGFEGMGCIHPRQVTIINEGFAPGPVEIEKSEKIILAYDEAKRNGLGVVSLGTKMIDAPVVARAQKIISLAVKLGKIPKDWKPEFSTGGN